jgi:hypothetical protein
MRWNRRDWLFFGGAQALIVAVVGMVLFAWASRPTADAAIPVPHSRWLAQCRAFPVDATAGITVERVRVRPRRVTALLRAGKRRGWLQAHRLGTLSGAGVWAVRGPTALRNRMALSPECSGANGRVIPWTSAKDLPPAAKAWLAERVTCCGEATYKDRTYHAWPCARGLPTSTQYREGFTVVRFDGYGPPVVGSEGACAEYAQED